MGMFRVIALIQWYAILFHRGHNKLLTFFLEFGLYVDKHGESSHTMGTIECEGMAEPIALHPPYILLFNT